MKSIPLCSLLSMAFFSGTSPLFAAAPTACARAHFTEVRSLAQLPQEIGVALGAERHGLDGIADRDGKFNKTDVANPELPLRRFSLAAVSSACVLVAIERGGIAHYVELFAFERIANRWQSHKLAIMNSAPRLLAELISHANK